MKLQVHSIHFDADNKLINFIQRKLDKLDTFYSRLVDGEVFLRLNNEGIENKTVEIWSMVSLLRKFQVKGEVCGSPELHFEGPSSIVPVPAATKV